LADKLIANNDNQLLPVTKSATARQKIQRAFAGELLCPSDELLAFLDEDYDNDTIAEAADYFDVQESVPRTHLVNREILSPEALAYADS
jgi:Zn-dependent peptidase ImmA (M78 family)